MVAMSTTIDHMPPPAAGDDHGKSPHTPVPLPAPEALLDARETRRDGWMLFVFGFAAVALLASLVAVGFGSRAIDQSKTPAAAATAAATSASAPVQVHLSDFKIEPGDITAPAGGTLNVMNMGAVEHNLAIKGQSAATPMIPAGKTADLSLAGLAPGDYTVICQVPGHEAAGMTAKLHITAGGGGSTAAAATPTTAAAAMTADEMDAMMAKNTNAFVNGTAKTAGVGNQPLTPKVLSDGTKQFELTTKIVDWEVEPGKLVKAWTFNGMVPGPMIKVNPGDKVQFVVKNELPESTGVHFHGLTTPNSQDGVPDITQKPIKPGETFTYSFVAQSTPMVGMYHSHQDAVKQVPNGMAGAILVGDEPLPAGVTVAQQQIMMLNDSGTVGLSLNGKSFPATAPVVAKLGDWIEVQYMNEGLMAHPMHLHGMPQMVIAKDGYPLAQPVMEDTVNVSPGERYTVLIHADQAGAWAWHCHILTHAESDQGMFGMVTALIVK